jgi:hypothetical protein
VGKYHIYLPAADRPGCPKKNDMYPELPLAVPVEKRASVVRLLKVPLGFIQNSIVKGWLAAALMLEFTRARVYTLLVPLRFILPSGLPLDATITVMCYPITNVKGCEPST